MRATIAGLAVLLTSAFAAESDRAPRFVFPAIRSAGGIVDVPDAVEPARKGNRVVFDVTAGGDPQKVNKGLVRVARYVNMHAQAGVEPDQRSIALVLHGDATVVGMRDPAYERKTGVPHNPNVRLLDELRQAGVDVSVCGQAVIHRGFGYDDVRPEIPKAVSAMTVLVNRQNDGYAFVALD